MTDKKPRQSTITVDMGKPIAINGYEISSSGEIVLKKDGETIIPRLASFSKSHERDSKGPKQLVNFPLETGSLSWDLYRPLLDADFLYAVDTNTAIEPREGKYVSVSITSEWQIVPLRNEVKIERRGGYRLEHSDIDRTMAEKFGLVELIRMISKSKIQADPGLKILIITDHNLGDIGKINSRKLPLIPGNTTYLPINFTLMYASADKAKKNDSLYNQLIFECDAAASAELKRRTLSGTKETRH
jgi:hypothetical protein